MTVKKYPPTTYGSPEAPPCPRQPDCTCVFTWCDSPGNSHWLRGDRRYDCIADHEAGEVIRNGKTYLRINSVTYHVKQHGQYWAE